MVMVSEEYLVATPIKTDAAPWSLLVLSEVTVLGISLITESARERLSPASQEVHWVPNPMVLSQQAQKMPELHGLEQCNSAISSCPCAPFPGMNSSQGDFSTV